jgi:uncharacterized NAD(P)/FAD-binding protein YdhS
MALKRYSSERAGFDLAIIGGGFSGACLARELLNNAASSFRIVLIEPGTCRGRGIAYGTQDPRHLLNVPAGNMSAFAEDPNHFLRWARLNYDSGVQPDDFLPRRLFGDYSEALLSSTLRKYSQQIRWERDEAIDLRNRGNLAEITLRNGRRLVAKRVVLALGNFPPAELRVNGRALFGPRVTQNPWAINALDQVPAEGEILLVGSGLTSVDVVLSLRSRGFHGTIHMLSRHGLLPQQHTKTPSFRPMWTAEFPRTARGLVRLVRKTIRTAEHHGHDWRCVIDSLRSQTPAIWHSFSLRERSRFLRHLRAHWDAHRHRIAPEIGKVLDYQIRTGQVQMHAGRIIGFEETAEGAVITYRERSSQKLTRLPVNHVINCTGPEGNCRKLESPLLASLLLQGLTRPDPLHLGLDCTEQGALINREGVASDFLFTIGPSRKGILWESVAVPELREQASDLASLLAARRDHSYAQTPSSAHGMQYASVMG